MLGIIADLITIISLIITIITLFITLGIKRKIEKTIDKQQYFKERADYINNLKKFYVEINNNDILYSDILVTINEQI